MSRLALFAALASAANGFALSPSEVLLIVNRNVPESAEVAAHYRAKRGVPAENVVALDLPKVDDISRRDYDAKVVAPLRAALRDRKDKIKVLLCIYGVPLRVGGKEPNQQERQELIAAQAQLKKVQDRVKELEARLKELGAIKSDEVTRRRGELKAAQAEEKKANERRRSVSPGESVAALDNELMLLWWDDYPLARFIVNPLHFQVTAKYRESKPTVLMTARLDAPTAAIAKRMVDDAVEVEKVGLKGKVYVDARDSRFDPKSDQGYGYGGYDESMREMANLLREAGKMDVAVDNKSSVFAPGTCPNCALYCGWYSHANFVDSCAFVKGAVAWHLASSEAISLRRKDSKLWCPNILLNGACATLGPVAEPYTVGFPKPAEFFGFLATGEFTLVECYARTLNLTSWMCTLIGDPLYNPFKANPRLKSSAVLPSPKGGRFLLPAKE